MKKIVDYFSYYDETCKEILELRINMLKDYVDQFIICESNKTHSGTPIEYKLSERIKEYGLPSDKILIINLDIPDDPKLLPIDFHNSGPNSKNINSVKARARERMQRDALISVIDQFGEDTYFIVGDCDEIIKPEAIDFVTNIVGENPHAVIKIPLVYLEGRADLRVYDTNSMQPKAWDLSLFVCQKKHLTHTNPINIRCNHQNPYLISYCTQDGYIIQDLGWHFSWMGGAQKRLHKRDQFCHYQDDLAYLKTGTYNSQETSDILASPLKIGSIAPSLEYNTCLQKYDISELPKEIFNSARTFDFLFNN